MRLTRRERDIVGAMLKAKTNREIGAELGMTEQSVKNRLSALYRKVGVRNRLELFALLTQGSAVSAANGG